MALNIKNDEAERLIRQLARATNESLTAAVVVAVRERLARVVAAADDVQARQARILRLGQQISEALPAHGMKVEDLYDERGLPA